ncbi:structure-specific recognition protein [Sesbania bispinosa]|nr:structure-specific recognition protein [Sesbania bispinosa]
MGLMSCLKGSTPINKIKKHPPAPPPTTTPSSLSTRIVAVGEKDSELVESSGWWLGSDAVT